MADTDEVVRLRLLRAIRALGVRRPVKRVPAYAAAVLAFASAAVSLYWTLGGTVLLDTVGGTFEDLARDRSAGAVALGIAVVVVKVAAGLLALALVRPWGKRLGRRPLLVASAVGSVVLVLYGGVVVLVGGLVLENLVIPSAQVDEHALRWHVFVWDLWFLIWGVSLGLAAWHYRVDDRSQQPITDEVIRLRLVRAIRDLGGKHRS